MSRSTKSQTFLDVTKISEEFPTRDDKLFFWKTRRRKKRNVCKQFYGKAAMKANNWLEVGNFRSRLWCWSQGVLDGKTRNGELSSLNFCNFRVKRIRTWKSLFWGHGNFHSALVPITTNVAWFPPSTATFSCIFYLSSKLRGLANCCN